MYMSYFVFKALLSQVTYCNLIILSVSCFMSQQEEKKESYLHKKSPRTCKSQSLKIFPVEIWCSLKFLFLLSVHQTHCYSHKLNLVICHARSVPIVKNIMTQVKKLSSFFNNSQNRQIIFEKKHFNS